MDQKQQEHLIKRIHEVRSKSDVLATRYTGFMQLYQAACQDNNAQEMELYRQNCLSCVEQMMDNTAIQYMLARQLGDLT